MCSGGGSGQRGEKRGKSRRCSLIYLYGTACTADPSRNGVYPGLGWDCSRSDFDAGWQVFRPIHETKEVDRELGEDEEIAGEARDQDERSEASRRKSSREAKSTHHSNAVSSRAKSQTGPRSTEIVTGLTFEPE